MKNQGERIRKTKSGTKKKQKKERILKLKCFELIPYIVDLAILFIFSGVKNIKKIRHQWWECAQISIVAKKDNPRATQRWPQIIIIESKQAINYMHFLIIIFILCHSFDQKTKIGFTFNFTYWRLNLGTHKLVCLTSWCREQSVSTPNFWIFIQQHKTIWYVTSNYDTATCQLYKTKN